MKYEGRGMDFVSLDLLDENLTKLSSDFIETRRTLGHIEVRHHEVVVYIMLL